MGSRSSRAVLILAGMVRPTWATAVMSVPFEKITFTMASFKSLRAAATGTGPTPGISETSSPSVCPLRRASASTRMWTMARGPGWSSPTPEVAMATRASAA